MDISSFHQPNTGYLVVGLNAPHSFLVREASLDDILGYGSQHVEGHGVELVFGPKTDATKLLSAIVDTSHDIQTTIHVVLYDKSGRGRNVTTTCSPLHSHEGCVIACTIYLEDSQSITLAQAFQDNTSPKILISAEEPNVVHMINSEVTRIFGLEQADVIGRPVCSVQAFRLNYLKLKTLVQTALEGRVARDTSENGSTRESTNQGHKEALTCIPVIESQLGAIRYFLILPSQQQTGPVDAEQKEDRRKEHSPHVRLHDCSQTQYTPVNLVGANESGLHNTTRNRVAPDHQELQDIEPPFSALALRTTQHTNAEPSDGWKSPQLMRKESTQEAGHFSLSTATEKNSATNAKAGRKELGVKQWPIKARPETCAQSKPGDYSLAYVRKLQRKYSESGKAKPTMGSPRSHSRRSSCTGLSVRPCDQWADVRPLSPVVSLCSSTRPATSNIAEGADSGVGQSAERTMDSQSRWGTSVHDNEEHVTSTDTVGQRPFEAFDEPMFSATSWGPGGPALDGEATAVEGEFLLELLPVCPPGHLDGSTDIFDF